MWRQQRVQRVAYHLKQALAKATAIKEGRKESLEVKQARGLALTLALVLTLTLAPALAWG